MRQFLVRAYAPEGHIGIRLPISKRVIKKEPVIMDESEVDEELLTCDGVVVVEIVPQPEPEPAPEPVSDASAVEDGPSAVEVVEPPSAKVEIPKRGRRRGTRLGPDEVESVD